MLNISKFRSRNRVKRTKSKAIPRKSKFHAQDNPLKSYKRRPKADIQAFAEAARAARLRNSTNAELRFYQILLQAGYAEGKDFEREKIFYYGNRFAIADFFVGKASIIFECDGLSHQTQREHDKGRDSYFAGIGIKTIRLTNRQVLGKSREIEILLRKELKL